MQPFFEQDQLLWLRLHYKPTLVLHQFNCLVFQQVMLIIIIGWGYWEIQVKDSKPYTQISSVPSYWRTGNSCSTIYDIGILQEDTNQKANLGIFIYVQGELHTEKIVVETFYKYLGNRGSEGAHLKHQFPLVSKWIINIFFIYHKTRPTHHMCSSCGNK